MQTACLQECFARSEDDNLSPNVHPPWALTIQESDYQALLSSCAVILYSYMLFLTHPLQKWKGNSLGLLVK
jgi:hypothetical protein